MTEIPPSEARKFLEALFRNKISEAERILQHLQENHPNDIRYIHALKGIFQSYVGDDKESLIYTIYLNKELWRRRKEVAKTMMQTRDMLGSRDRFFDAWNDVLHLLDRLPKPAKIIGQPES